jgi:hypothetical protein
MSHAMAALALSGTTIMIKYFGLYPSLLPRNRPLIELKS